MRGRPINLREGRHGGTKVDVASVGICGSDLHYQKDGSIGSAIIHEQFVPGPARAWLAQRASDFAVSGLWECLQRLRADEAKAAEPQNVSGHHRIIRRLAIPTKSKSS
jgi:hypothetical protein